MTLRKILLQQLFCLIALCAANLQVSAQDEFKPSGKVWGYAFGDVFVKTAGDTATWASRAEYSGVPENVYAFTIRRGYLGYDYTISPKFSTSALLEASDVTLTLRGERSVFLKALNLRWKDIYPRADLIIGQQSTIAFSFIAERVWNYRSIEKTITDARGIRSSNDLGLAIYGRFDSLGNFGYNLMVGNGNGPRPEELTINGRHKIYSGEVYAYVMDRKIVLDLYGDILTAENDRNVTVVKGFVGYQSSPFTAGVEVMLIDQNNIKSDGENARPFGYSIFARSELVKDRLVAFARYDSFDPDNNYRDQDVLTSYNASSMFRHYDETLFIAGLDYSPHKNVHIMPNIWINTYSPKAEAEILPKREADVVPRVTFYFIFR